jgi:S-adenosylmethionine/arginine decarboxylase-like enzyme
VGVLSKVVVLDEILEEVQRVSQVLKEKIENQGLKVGILLKKSHMTIITCEFIFGSILI